REKRPPAIRHTCRDNLRTGDRKCEMSCGLRNDNPVGDLVAADFGSPRPISMVSRRVRTCPLRTFAQRRRTASKLFRLPGPQIAALGSTLPRNLANGVGNECWTGESYFFCLR